MAILNFQDHNKPKQLTYYRLTLSLILNWNQWLNQMLFLRKFD